MQSSWTKIGLLLVCAMACSVPAHAQERLALLIGNQNYSDQVGRLKNPHADIDLVGAALTKVGFKITAIKDADYATMLKAAKTFASQVRDAGPGAVSFFYYSGHGAADPKTQVNYLIPVDAPPAEDPSLWDNSVELRDVIDKLSTSAPNATHYVVFDACRDELQLKPSTSKGMGQRSSEKGFVPMAQTSGLLIAYSTAPTKTASDEGEKGGPYARVLAEELVRPGIEFRRRLSECPGARKASRRAGSLGHVSDFAHRLLCRRAEAGGSEGTDSFNQSWRFPRPCRTGSIPETASR